MSNPRESDPSSEVDLYRESERQFREIHDWESLAESGIEIADAVQCSPHFVIATGSAGVLGFRSIPDAYFIPTALDDKQQIGLAFEALSEFIEPPNKTNLAAHGQVPAPLWSHCDEFRKLRWATIGWQYDWSSRSYSSMNTMPDTVSRLSSAVLRAVGIPEVEMTGAIVNFYHGHRISDRLGGHIDDVDGDSSPLISVSLGLPCIFLLGGTTRAESPLPVLLRAGDILVLAGSARLRVHGVPTLIVPRDLLPKQIRKRRKMGGGMDAADNSSCGQSCRCTTSTIGHARVSCSKICVSCSRLDALQVGCIRLGFKQVESPHIEDTIRETLRRTRINFSIRNVNAPAQIS